MGIVQKKTDTSNYMYGLFLFFEDRIIVLLIYCQD
jgi:hypothetical protein